MNDTDRSTTERIDWSIVIVIIIGTFMAVLDGTIVNVSLPKMMAAFRVSESDIQWVATAYMLTLGVVMPMTGYLGDRYGYKRMYFVALGLFTLGSALCGASWNLTSMVVSRVVQAIDDCFIVSAVLCLVAIGFTLFLREGVHKTEEQSALGSEAVVEV